MLFRELSRMVVTRLCTKGKRVCTASTEPEDPCIVFNSFTQSKNLELGREPANSVLSEPDEQVLILIAHPIVIPTPVGSRMAAGAMQHGGRAIAGSVFALQQQAVVVVNFRGIVRIRFVLMLSTVTAVVSQPVTLVRASVGKIGFRDEGHDRD